LSRLQERFVRTPHRKSSLAGTFTDKEFTETANSIVACKGELRELARQVLVDGVPMGELAEKTGQPRQNIWWWCSRLDKARTPDGWVRVTVVLPKRIAAEVKATAKAERKKWDSKQNESKASATAGT
jgi:hypothetical protein